VYLLLRIMPIRIIEIQNADLKYRLCGEKVLRIKLPYIVIAYYFV
jgi:hypothetical protein